MSDYVSIVIVSHSENLALGIKEIIDQIAEHVVIEVAGGTKDKTIGTSLEKIEEAIERAYSKKGTLILCDMGSSKMNAQFALETNDYKNIEIIDAPVVEGAYIAAVKSSIGKSTTEIKQKLHEFFPDFLQNV